MFDLSDLSDIWQASQCLGVLYDVQTIPKVLIQDGIIF